MCGPKAFGHIFKCFSHTLCPQDLKLGFLSYLKTIKKCWNHVTLAMAMAVGCIDNIED